MRLKNYILFLVSSLFFINISSTTKACGYYESPEDYRAMMFRASLPGMAALYPFQFIDRSSYSTNNSDRNENDRYRNCLEWQQACSPEVLIEDIYSIQYTTSPALFIETYEKGDWPVSFSKNTLIDFLIRPENKELLDYMLFAKKAELTEVGTSSRFEEWDQPTYRRGKYKEYENNRNIQDLKLTLWEEARELLPSLSSPFLQHRYAFQVCRLSYQLDEYDVCCETYQTYIGKMQKDNLMSIWAGLFYALCNPDERYRWLIQTFEQSDEKKLRCVQLFDDGYHNEELTNHEKSVALVMQNLYNPGKALEDIKTAYQLDKRNIYIPFLIQREINKLEYWLMTPVFYNNYTYERNYIFHCGNYKNDNGYDDAYISKNLATDNHYLIQLKGFITELLSVANQETKDYYQICLAHLSLLEENPADAKKYLSRISAQANPTIQLQKKLENIWLAINTYDLYAKQLQNSFMENIADLERVDFPDFQKETVLYTLNLSLADKYIKRGDRVYGNLLRMRSDLYRNNSSWYTEMRKEYDYSKMQYFDNNATVADMDQLLALLEKKEKSPFESYLLDQPVGTPDDYKELKGTIAFRTHDLQTAYETFRSMPQDYWSKRARYINYLNEDPFIPKGLQKQKNRKYDYPFNKTGFVEKLIRLQEEAGKGTSQSAAAYIELGNAFFNTSYWGNSWLMTCYGQSINDPNYFDEECLPSWLQNYLLASRATESFRQALKLTQDDEEKAYIYMMLHYINRLAAGVDRDAPYRHEAEEYGNKFREYSNTSTFKKYTRECPGIGLFR